MDLELENKHIYIAGASRGIGLAMAEGFLREGAKVAITGRTESTLREAEAKLAGIAGEGAVFAMPGDMTQSADIAATMDAAIEALGPLHCAIANVGIGNAPLGVEVSDDDWDGDIAQNLTGSMFVAREAIRRLRALPEDTRAGASVIFISSIAGVDALGTSIPYGATKAALNHAAASIAKIVGRHGIRVNALAPGNILFPGGNWERITAANPDFWKEFIDREVALQRFGTVDEMADAALFLASARARFITGTTLVADGGQVKSFG